MKTNSRQRQRMLQICHIQGGGTGIRAFWNDLSAKLQLPCGRNNWLQLTGIKPKIHRFY